MVTLGHGERVYEPVVNWYRLPDDISLTEAIGVATDSVDNLYVFNRGDPPLIVFDRDGNYLRSWGDGQFVRPHGIWIDSCRGQATG